MSKLNIWWHMIIKQSEPRSVEYAIKSLDSLQGLYDGIVIGVDEDKSSNELYEALSHYPNTVLFRLHFIDFAQAMQETLQKIPSYGVDYIGRSDGDEVLMTDPYEIRKWLADTRPDSVNCATHYLYTIGWCQAGETYRIDGVRIWRYGTRKWGNAVHQYPYVISGVDAPVIGDITFDHIKESDPLSMTDLNIRLMQREIDNGNRAYLWFIAKEYSVRGEVDKAISLCFEYLKHEIDNEQIFNLALWGMSELCGQRGDFKGLMQKLQELHDVLPNNQEVQKYINAVKRVEICD
jgi:hypothetical protein